MTKQKTGSYYENDDYRIEVKYSKKARDKELIRFRLKKGNTIEFTATDLLKIITENIKKKDLALALSEQELEMESILMTQVVRQINFTMDRDVKKGEAISFQYPQQYPYFLALCEQMYKIAKVSGKVEAVPLSLVKEAEEEMIKQNSNLAEKINKPTLDAIEKSKQVENKNNEQKQ